MLPTTAKIKFKNSTFLKVILVSFFSIGFFLWKPVLMFIFPGITIIGYKNRGLIKSFSSFLYYSVFASLSWWIVSFWVLKYFPVRFSVFIYATLFVSVILTVLIRFNEKVILKFSKFDYFLIMTTIIFSIIFWPFYASQSAPAGADMAAHTYTARVIFEKNSFPTSYEPLLPVKSFGAAPFGFPVLTAAITFLSGLPIYKSALLLTALTYILLGTAIFKYLSVFFRPLTAFITTLLIFWGSENIIGYIYWGGNPTLLSIAFLLTAFSYFMEIPDTSVSKYKCLLFTILIFASFTIHPIPFVSLFVGIVPLFLYSLYRQQLGRNKNIFLVTSAVIFILMSLPFLSTYQPLSKQTLDWVKAWQTNLKYPWNWDGNIGNSLITIPLYLSLRINPIMLSLFSTGILISIFKKIPFWQIFLLLSVIFWVEIVNSHYWFLPLSPLLYPDRVVTLLLIIPMSFFIGVFIDSLIHFLKEVEFFNLISKYKVVSTAALFLITVLSVRNFMQRYNNIRAAYFFNVSLTKEALDVFDWIEKNTGKKDIFLNNYGDAGIWLPGVAGRRAVYNHGIVSYFDETLFAKPYSHPDYAFIGGKTVYPEAVNLYSKDLESDTGKYRLVYQSGSSRVYKIIY